MAYGRRGDKSLSSTMMISLTNAYYTPPPPQWVMRHMPSICSYNIPHTIYAHVHITPPLNELWHMPSICSYNISHTIYAPVPLICSIVKRLSVINWFSSRMYPDVLLWGFFHIHRGSRMLKYVGLIDRCQTQAKQTKRKPRVHFWVWWASYQIR